MQYYGTYCICHAHAYHLTLGERLARLITLCYNKKGFFGDLK